MAAKGSLLAADLHIGPSRLYVRDLEKVTRYYQDIVGLEALTTTPGSVTLGHGSVPVIELAAKPEYQKAPAGSAGLFHNAIVFRSRAALAAAVLNILQKAAWSYEGSADHLVSEAFYFHDPENNGLELYFDRPRESWEWTGGSIRMDTLYLDPMSYIAEHAGGTQDAGKEMGHVHLRVGDVAAARKFYVEQVGFDVTADMGSALFVSVGGYHHHMAMNTWLSRGAGKRDPALGLAEIKLILPGDGSVDKLAGRLAASTLDFTQKQDVLTVNDPWNNRLIFAAE